MIVNELLTVIEVAIQLHMHDWAGYELQHHNIGKTFKVLLKICTLKLTSFKVSYMHSYICTELASYSVYNIVTGFVKTCNT